MNDAPINFTAACNTTAMGIMPHTDVEKAVDLVLGLDVPYWPQLPNISLYEDMYVQTSEGFPGIVIDHEEGKISFDTGKFERELSDYSLMMDRPEAYSLSERYSSVYHRFLSRDLTGYPAIRGQVTGPVSFGFRVMDEQSKPIIYNDGVRGLLFDFIQKKVNVQYRQLKQKNDNAFVWLDEPGLGWVFSGLSGYSDTRAREDYEGFFAGIEGPKALHLCANVNLPYLLGLGTQVLSFDAYQMELLPRAYVDAVADFIRGGGVISWGIVPTDSENLGKETPETLAGRISDYWDVVAGNGSMTRRQVAQRALIAPARCCLKNAGRVGADEDSSACKIEEGPGPAIEEQLVEKAFAYLRDVSQILKREFGF